MTAQEVLAALSEPFDRDEVKFKPQTVSGNRCLAVAYIDARCVMDRLDDVVGPLWSDAYERLPNDSVVCKLRVQIDGAWVEKADVGSPSEQDDEGDRTKAAFSDALKRAAVKFGIGRYLYRLPKSWVDFDPKKRAIINPPTLPTWALPKAKPATTPAGSKPPNRSAALVTTAEATELQKLLQTNRSIDPAKFLALYHVGRLSELPREHLGNALSILKAPPRHLLRDLAA